MKNFSSMFHSTFCIFISILNVHNYHLSDEFLKISGGIGELGKIQYPIALCLLAAWAIVFIVLSKGVKSLGKVIISYNFRQIFKLEYFFSSLY